jgi:hypothetical protein
VGDTSGDQDDRPSATPILVEGLGDYGFGLENASPEVQAWFDQGLGHLWGFNHAEAARAFRMAQSLDPSCALCLWGEAYALGPTSTTSCTRGRGARLGGRERRGRARSHATRGGPHAALLARYAPSGEATVRC